MLNNFVAQKSSDTRFRSKEKEKKLQVAKKTYPKLQTTHELYTKTSNDNTHTDS